VAESAATAVLSREAVRALDAWTIAHHVASIELMERAGLRLAEILEEQARDLVRPGSPSRPRVLVLAGNGNNGGDGLVVARLLAESGWRCTVALCCGEPRLGGDAAINLERWRSAGGATTDLAEAKHLLGVAARTRDDPPFDLVLDAMFGTGLDRAVGEDVAAVIAAVDNCGLPVVAVDIPSGLCADTGMPLGAAVRAKATITLGAAKPGLFVGRGPDYVGRLIIADIGLADPAAAGVAIVGRVLDAALAASMLPQRTRTTHKGDVGHVLICGGSAGKNGAVLLGARAALRCGAGLVTMAVPQRLAATANSSLWEAMTIALADDGSGNVGSGAWAAIEPDAARYCSAAVGPGLGAGEGAGELVERFLESFPGRLVLDADALNAIARTRTTAEKLRARCRGGRTAILTPHPGEMARLLDSSSGAVQADRIGAVRACSSRFPGATIVLKGAATLVAGDERLRFNTTGNPGMASPGMGDVLSGVLAALSAVIDDPVEVASVGVYAHGLAGDLLDREIDGPGFFASEVADALPDAFAELRAAGAT
jgi:NAD(P)H-hydrate epimerase